MHTTITLIRCDSVYVIYPIRVGVLDVVSNSECHERASPLFMALGIWKPSQKYQRGLDMASHTSLDIHSNEAWSYNDYILIKNRSGTIKSATKVELMSSIQKKMVGYVTIWLR